MPSVRPSFIQSPRFAASTLTRRKVRCGGTLAVIAERPRARWPPVIGVRDVSPLDGDDLVPMARRLGVSVFPQSTQLPTGTFGPRGAAFAISNVLSSGAHQACAARRPRWHVQTVNRGPSIADHGIASPQFRFNIAGATRRARFHRSRHGDVPWPRHTGGKLAG